MIARLADRLDQFERRSARLEAENKRLRARLAQYEPEAAAEDVSQTPSPDRYGEDVADKLAAARAKKKKRNRQQSKRRGRRRTLLKFEDAQRIEKIAPAGVAADTLRLVRRRVAWRLENGKAILVGYEIYDAPGHPSPPIGGVPRRSEFGLEISIVLAFLVYIIGMSLDKACQTMAFFCEFPLSKSQADLLLTRLANEWSDAFDALCELLVHSAVVYTDETGWKIGTQGCSLWVFASELARVFVFGCRKDAVTLEQFLPKDLFAGCVVSDDAAVYGEKFSLAQKCWAHLLRKALKLTLMYPRRTRYRKLFEGLLEVFREGKRAAVDKRLGDAGRQARKDQLENKLCALLVQYPDSLPAEPSGAQKPAVPPPERTLFNLVAELRRLVAEDELFTFVIVPEAAPTNNEAERELRGPALARKAGRTDKSESGARRRSVVVSVFESLRQTLETFTLANVLEEVANWLERGTSCFEERAANTAADPPPAAALDSS